MENHLENEKIFDATLSLKRRKITSNNLAAVLLNYPLVTVKIIIAIYYQALRLLMKKVPFYPHPRDKEAPESANNL